mgnify:CR=1 FL=1
MRICRYNEGKVGLVKGDQLIDVTVALGQIPQARGPKMPGDSMIANLDTIKPEIEANRKMGYVQGVKNVKLKSPVRSPSKIVAAQANFTDRLSEAGDREKISLGRNVETFESHGFFLRENSVLAGVGDGITLGRTDGRANYVTNLAIILGRRAKNVNEVNALNYVAGYSIGVDIKVHGVEDRTSTKSFRSDSVLGPWLTTADEITDPDDLDLSLWINGKLRQQSNTKHLFLGCRQLIAYASKLFTLYPGDILMTEMPRDVSLLKVGDRLKCRFDIIGQMELGVR